MLNVFLVFIVLFNFSSVAKTAEKDEIVIDKKIVKLISELSELKGKLGFERVGGVFRFNPMCYGSLLFVKKKEWVLFDQYLIKEIECDRLIDKKILMGVKINPYNKYLLKRLLSESVSQNHNMIKQSLVLEVLKKNEDEISEEVKLNVLFLYMFRVSQYLFKTNKQIDQKDDHFLTLTGFVPKKEKEVYQQCPICFDDIDSDDVFIMSWCEHRFCYDCIQHYFSQKFKELSTSIKCPVLECSGCCVLDDFVSSKLDILVVMKWFEKMFRGRLCFMNLYLHCKTPDCCGYQLVGEKKDCEFCLDKYCKKCAVGHLGLTCRQYKKKEILRKKSELCLVKYLKSNKVQRCPYCQIVSSRVEGEGHCNKMTCVNCSKLWLWVKGSRVGVPFKGYYYHNRRNEVFDNKKEIKRWEKRSGRKWR